MGGVLEFGKLLVAAWLHGNWRNPKVSMVHKGYLSLAIIALMLITSIGIYGYLAKGFLDQQTPLGAVSIQIAQKQQQIDTATENIKHLNDRQSQLDAAVNSLIGQNQVVRSQTIRNQQKKERDQIVGEITTDQKDIERLTNELVPLKMSTNDVEAKLGPIKYVAELFGWTKPDVAVRFVILILMFAFDPLAVVLIISGSISFNEWLEERKLQQPEPKIVEVQQAPKKISRPDPFEPIIIGKRLDTDIKVDLIPVTGESDKETILAILQRNPDTMEDIIDTVIEWHEQHSNQKKL